MERIKNWLNGDIKRSTAALWYVVTVVIGVVIGIVTAGCVLWGWVERIQTTIEGQYDHLHHKLMQWFNRM